MKAKDPDKALLDYRNSPLDTGFSPAQLFLGRRLKTTLPTTSKLLQPGHGNSKERHAEMVSCQQKQKFYFDKKVRGNLSTFRAGDPVVMKFGDTWKRAEVVTPRSYVVRDERKQYRRNRRMLRPAVVASRDSDLPVTVPVQSETDCVANQTSGQTPSQSDDNSQMVRKENVVKTRSGRVVKIPARFRDDNA